MNRRVMLCGLGVLMMTPLGASERLTIRVSPSVAFAPANLVVRTMVEADRDHRAIAIVAESERFYRSSEIQLDGDRAPRTTILEFKSLPGGTYDVTATLIGASGTPLTSVHKQVSVISNSAGR